MNLAGHSQVFHADQEHSSLRALVVFLLITFLWLFFGLVRWAVATWASPAVQEFITAVSCAGSLTLSLVVTWVLEQWLKKVWHSGRNLSVASNEILIHDQKRDEITIDLKQNFMHLTWYYHLNGFQQTGRERRLSKKWLCLACQVQQDEYRFAVYTYLPPHEARAWLEDKSFQFRKLDPEDLLDKDGRKKVGNLRLKLPKEVITGKDGRHWLAEQHRWQSGFELAPADFDAFMKHLMTYFKT
ncbi:MAG: hypothetical protein ACE5EY_03935 [Anaerolineae bacterium]